ncbi:hypothetical protein BIW11_05420 [Tropilaelaps mercedesae]|uniref:Uncharacterized protein n=1 Tax=Tropilaelaps mercedesae TaxID=418985 RepID=A0A1V9Y2R6_9ACAR|nr:hypothetical protein BIW11_05420 [Tropilaelaps mercedesae]
MVIIQYRQVLSGVGNYDERRSSRKVVNVCLCARLRYSWTAFIQKVEYERAELTRIRQTTRNGDESLKGDRLESASKW